MGKTKVHVAASIVSGFASTQAVEREECGLSDIEVSVDAYGNNSLHDIGVPSYLP